MTIAIILLILWIGGLALHVTTALIHLVLVVALIMFVLHFFTGRRGGA